MSIEWEGIDELPEEERRYIRTAVFDYMTCLQMEDQFNEDFDSPDSIS